MANRNAGDGVVAKNRRAHFDYELGDRFEAGLVLKGTEVKMLRQGQATIAEAYCVIERGEVWVLGINIPVSSGFAFPHEAKRKRKLLLNAREIDTLIRALEREGMTAVPTVLYFKGGRAKLEIALAKGKKKGDKRETVKARDAEREARQAMANARRGRG